MARVNIGIHPKYISDQHLIAESVEITMITGALRKDGFIIKSSVPEEFSLGKGHINFFKNKLAYLKDRLDLVNSHLRERGFSPSTKIVLNEFPINLRNHWQPSLKDSMIVRERIAERLASPLKAKSGFHKHFRNPINVNEFIDSMINSPLNNL